MGRNRLTLRALVTLVVLYAGTAVLDAGHERGERGLGIVASITNAPIVPDGNVTGRVTDFVIDLDADMDPAAPGRTLLAGRRIWIQLPAQFERDHTVPFRTAFTASDCVPLNLRCNTAFLLQGWPQHPVGFPPPNMANLWTVDFDEFTNTIVVTALRDLVAAPPLEPGIKQIHVFLAGFTNPRPGAYRVRVAAETGPDGTLERGSGVLRIVPMVRPAIAIASSFNSGAPNSIFQKTTPGSQVSLPYDFLLWNRDGEPFTDVALRQIGDHLSLLVHDERVVGYVLIDAPARASGQKLLAAGASASATTPVSGVPTARLRAVFEAGDVPGEYVLTVGLLDGNRIGLFVQVQ